MITSALNQGVESIKKHRAVSMAYLVDGWNGKPTVKVILSPGWVYIWGAYKEKRSGWFHSQLQFINAMPVMVGSCAHAEYLKGGGR